MGLPKGGVVIRSYDDDWATEFKKEKEHLRKLLGDCVIEHIGSTAVKGLSAKPVIDISVGFTTEQEISGAAKILENAGYDFHPNARGSLTFVRRNASGHGTHIIHVETKQKTGESVKFRDYLKTHPEAAREYEAVKFDLAARFPNDRRAYSQGKVEFIKSVLERTGLLKQHW